MLDSAFKRFTARNPSPLILLLFLFPLLGTGPVHGQTPGIIASDSVGCPPFNVSFSTTDSQEVNDYQWSFGNGVNSSTAHPSVIFSDSGSYDVSVIRKKQDGSTDTIVHSEFIRVKPNPKARFTIDSLYPCISNASADFNNRSEHATAHVWDFGDGASSTKVDPTHHYKNTGSYEVKLVAMNEEGCKDIETTDQKISITPDPEVGFSVDNKVTCDTNKAFQFTDKSASTIVEHHWSFGDGEQAEVADPSHQYSAPGSYDVQLTITDQKGCVDSLRKKDHISVRERPEPQFSVDRTEGCIPFQPELKDQTPQSAAVEWSISNGTELTGEKVRPAFTQPGTYVVEMMVTDKYGCKSSKAALDTLTALETPKPGFERDTSLGCRPLQVDFTDTAGGDYSPEWQFGDGASSTVQNPEHSYKKAGTFSPVLQATKPNGCTETVKGQKIRVVDCEGAFRADTTVGCGPLMVNFEDITEKAVAWQWVFGNGDTANGRNPSTTFKAPGEYDVILIVENSLGITDTVHRPGMIRVTEPQPDLPAPKVDSGCVPFTVSFNGNAIGTDSWEWDFGEGTSANNVSPTHTYTSPGSYEVTLKTRTPEGCNFSTVRGRFKVRETEVGFAVEKDSCPPNRVHFRDSSANVVSRKWAFGDGDSSMERTETHRYTETGTYPVTLFVENEAGCEKMVTSFVEVDSLGCSTSSPNDSSDTTPPDSSDADVDPDDPSGPGGDSGQPDDSGSSTFVTCSPLEVQFFSPVAEATKWLWKFGDGHTATREHPEHIYKKPGLYTLTLITTDAQGKQDTIVKPNLVRLKGHQSALSMALSSDCDSIEADLQGKTDAEVAWNWDLDNGTTDTTPSVSTSYPVNSGTYELSLTTTDAKGCSDHSRATISTKLNKPYPDYDTLVCLGQPLFLSANGPSDQKWKWDLGDGSTSTQHSVQHSYTQAGTYDIRLTVTDTMGCKRNYDMPDIKVIGVEAGTSTDQDASICTGKTMTFKASDPDADEYIWNFPDMTRKGRSISRSFNDPGIYGAQLTVKKNGCTAVDSLKEPIEVNEASADFEVKPGTVCFPSSPVQFIGQSDSAITQKWYFGDGESSSDANPVHSYQTPPSGPTSLVITDVNGCRDSTTKNAVKEFNPDFSVKAGKKGCAPLKTTFSVNTKKAVAWDWSFGDGTTSTLEEPTHVYEEPGSYDVELVATAPSGCQDTVHHENFIRVNGLEAAFEASVKGDCAPVIADLENKTEEAVSFTWEFGDGTGSSAQNPTHIYNTPGTYPITLITEGPKGCQDTLTKTQGITIPGPIAAPTAPDTAICLGDTVHFGNGSYNTDIREWSFGDGTTDSAKTPKHVYQDTGHYEVFLSVRDSTGCTDMAGLKKGIRVYPRPEARFSVSDTVGCEPLAVVFSDSSENVQNWQWYLGDTLIKTRDPGEHLYNKGDYQAFLVGDNPGGCPDSSQKVQIRAHQRAEANFGVNTLEGCQPRQVEIRDSSAHASSWTWSFGNGKTTTGPEPEPHAYHDPGLYNISLRVNTPQDCPDSTKTGGIKVFERPNAGISIDTPKGCHPLEVALEDASKGSAITSYYWESAPYTGKGPGDTTLSFGPGKHDITHAIGNKWGCWDSIRIDSAVHVYDTLAPQAPRIERVSVSNNSSVLVDWKVPPQQSKGSFDHFNMYRKKKGYPNFQPAWEIDTLANTALMDTGLITLEHAYSYKLQTHDVCGGESSQKGPPHTTMNLEAEPTNKRTVRLEWNHYGGKEPKAYLVFRKDQKSGNFKPIASVNPPEHTYFDTAAVCRGAYAYRIKAMMLADKPGVHSWSDTAKATPGGLSKELFSADIIRSTVIDDRDVLTEWQTPDIGHWAIDGYKVLKKGGNDSSFHAIKTIPAPANAYTDPDVDVNLDRYQYRVRSVSVCKTGLKSRIGSSILLTGSRNEDETRLEWTPYVNWDEGVDHYEIQIRRPDGSWETIETVNGERTKALIAP